MTAGGDNRAQLRPLLEEALTICLQLQRYTADNFGIIMSNDDEKIIEVIDKRDAYIEALAGLEEQIDDILNGSGEHVRRASLPPDEEEIRNQIRTLLVGITARDMETMKIISGRMQTYRNETLKARSKQSLSAYMRGADSSYESGGIDLSK